MESHHKEEMCATEKEGIQQETVMIKFRKNRKASMIKLDHMIVFLE